MLILAKGLMLGALLAANSAFADSLIITGQRIIDKSVTYQNANLDLSHGSLLVTNKAVLTIVNSNITGTLTPTNPNLIDVQSGGLVLQNDQMTVTTQGLKAVPGGPSLYNAMHFIQGTLTLTGNQFTIDQPYMAGLFLTDRQPTTNFVINHNLIRNFHGGFFLTNTSNAKISYNKFTNVSLSNIFTESGKSNTYSDNIILYSGNNGFDVIDSDGITLYNNYVSLSSCYSIFILRSQNVTIDHNKIIGGITYAIYAAPTIGLNGLFDIHLKRLIRKPLHDASAYKNSNLTITANYLAQNRYGISTISVDGLTVQNNIFVQRFNDSLSRKFWTNNDILLKSTIGISWTGNWYKEAFTQDPNGSNAQSSQLVVFPTSGGVSL
jgi:parallel beta-helix repeat protein